MLRQQLLIIIIIIINLIDKLMEQFDCIKQQYNLFSNLLSWNHAVEESICELWHHPRHWPTCPVKLDSSAHNLQFECGPREQQLGTRDASAICVLYGLHEIQSSPNIIKEH